MSKIYNKHMDQAVRTIDSVQPTLGQEKTKAFKRNLESKKLFKKANARKIEKEIEKKAKGGRVGLKGGTNPFARKSNIKKIQEVFGPKKPKKRMQARKGSPDPKKKFPDLTGDGKVTFADVLKGRGVINGKKKQKKKVI